MARWRRLPSSRVNGICASLLSPGPLGVADTTMSHRFDAALRHGLVKPASRREQDLDPKDLLYPSDYRSPSELEEIMGRNEVSRGLLERHNETRRRRHDLLL
jgi:hypothetical protein